MMRKLIFGLFILSVFYSCNKDQPALTKEEINHKIDSLTEVRIHQSDVQAKRDLDDRMKIEVKVKVDSIVNAWSLQAKADTANKHKGNVSPAPRAVPAISKGGNI